MNLKCGYSRSSTGRLHSKAGAYVTRVFPSRDVAWSVRGTIEDRGTPYRLFPVVHVLKLKKVMIFPDHPTNILRVAEVDWVAFDEGNLLEDSWKTELEDNVFEVERNTDVRSGRKTRFGRVHRNLSLLERIQ